MGKWHRKWSMGCRKNAPKLQGGMTKRVITQSKFQLWGKKCRTSFFWKLLLWMAGVTPLLPTLCRISPYMSIMWQQPLGSGLKAVWSVRQWENSFPKTKCDTFSLIYEEGFSFRTAWNYSTAFATQTFVYVTNYNLHAHRYLLKPFSLEKLLKYYSPTVADGKTFILLSLLRLVNNCRVFLQDAKE